MGVDEVAAVGREVTAEGPPGAEGVERRGEGGAPLHPLVGLEAAAVAQHLQTLRGVAEGAHGDAAVVPAGGDFLRVRGEHGHPVAAAHQGAGEVADEGAGGVPGEAGVGLGEEEEV